MFTDNTEAEARKQDDRVTKTVETSAGAKIKCPKCGGRGKIVRLQFGDSWATYEYRIGEEPSYDMKTMNCCTRNFGIQNATDVMEPASSTSDRSKTSMDYCASLLQQ